MAPILLYGAETWGFDNMDVIENVHTRFCKIITKKSKYCHNSFIYGELGRFPLQITATIRVLYYWNKVINGKKDKICFLIYNMMKHLNCIGKYTSPWLGYVKSTLENCGLKNVWISHVQSGSGVSSECVKRILQDQFLQKWSSRISVEEDFSSYRIYKNVHEFEEYVDLLPEYLKYSLLDFRTGSQKLPVNCRSDPNYQYQGKSASALSAEKDLWVMNFISYLNVMVLKNLGYQLYQNTIELDVAL